MKKSPFLIVLLVASMLLAQFAPATAAPLGSDRIPPAPASLNEVIEYYGRLGDIEGPIGVIVEFSGKPAALSYAEGKEKFLAPQALASATRAQVNLLQREQDNFASALQGKGIQVRELFRTQRVYNGIWLYVDASQVAELAKMPGVKALHPIIPKELEHTTSVPLVGALQAWAGAGNYQGDNISIGIIDTGIDYIHTNFGGPGDYTGQDFTTLGETGNLFPTAKVVGGWDFVGDAYNAAGSGSQLVPVPDPDPMDCNGHGSHVAGTAAGLGVLPDGSTYVEGGSDTYANLVGLSANDYIAKFRIGPGVAPKADLYALRVFGCEGSTAVTDLAIEWAMDPNDDGDLSDHLDVINMSLGSSFGSEFDSSAAASNNAAAAGVIVVTSSGNSGDLYYVTGSPGVAHRAISVANSMDSGAVVSAFELVSTAGTMTPGTYYAVEAAFGPTTFNVTGDLAYGTPANGCGAGVPIAGVSGKIALIDRGVCNFTEKYQNAVLGGATGVLVANNLAGAPFGMGGTPTGATTIPAMMTTLDIGTALKTDLLAGTVNVRLTTDYQNQFVFVDPSLEDTLTASSSRGIARVTNYLKPDIAAPGDTIFSTATGTGNEGVSFGGTSMAAPHVAGAMAILREQKPAWTVAELKALVMNTATEEITQGASTSTPSRVGAGRMVIPNALDSDVIAFNADIPAMVSVPFGVVKVLDTATGIDQTLTKSITISNKSASSETYDVAFALRYQANPGITFSLVDGADNPLTSVTVAAGGTETVTVKVELDAAALEKTRDATISTASGRSFMAESGGLVIFTSTGSAPTLRVPVHISARAASEMEVQETSLQLPAAASGSISLTPAGTPVDLSSDVSLATIFELLGTSPNEGSSTGSVNSADLQHIGAMSNYGLPGVSSPTVYFGLSTYGEWDTPRSTEFDIYVDANGDGTEDYVIYNSALSGTDGFVTIVVNLATSAATASHYINAFTGVTNTNAFNNNVMMMPVAPSLIGLSASDTDFDFYIVTFHRDAPGVVDLTDWYSYDIAKRAFTTTNPGISNTPAWSDDANYSPTFDIAYNKAYMNANTQGLLVLHHHNATNTAEAIPFNHGSAIPSTWVGGVAVYADQPVVAVGRPHLGAEVASYVGQGAGNTTQYVPMLFKGAFGGGYNAALYVQNVSTASADLTIDFIDSTGTTVHTKTDTLGAGASKGYWLPSESGVPNGFAGGVKVTSTENILAVGRPHINGQVMTYNGMGMGATSAWLPMFFKNGFGNYNTALYVQNVTNSSADLTIEYLNLDGTVACTYEDTLDANASKGYWSLAVTCDTGALPMGFVGGVKVTSTENILAVGRAHLGTQITTYNGFDTGTPDSYVPMMFRRAFGGGSYNAALYLQNVSGSSASVTIDYRDNAGNLAATQNVTLEPGAISSIWLPAVAGLPDGFVGGAFISSDQPVIAVGRPHLGTEITAYNGAPAMAGVAYLPMLFKNAFAAPYQSAFYLQNTGSSAAKASIFFYDEAGALLCIKGVDMAPRATVGFWSVTTACIP